MRYKLVPTRGRGDGRWFSSKFIWGRDDALADAREFFEEKGVPVLVIEAPEDSSVLRQVCVVGGERQKPRRRAARAA